MAKGRVVVDAENCKGCELCVHVCPPKVLVSGSRLNSKGYYPVEIAALGCTGCALCALMCPDVCLTVYRERASRQGDGPAAEPQVSLCATG
ncbi:MAG: 4Fe-4S dicluster domain-containing protein [Firmicutes bacterium]|nr:4Fe-4S dicluster domain-containing protein [Bacillota bacterium]